MKNHFLLTLVLTAALLSCAPIPYDGPLPGQSPNRESQQIRVNDRNIKVPLQGKASFMADELHGHKTAGGETFSMYEMVAAHPSLPFGSIVRVTNLENNKSVQVRIIDRGPFVTGRIIDVSFEAAKKLGFVQQGTTPVELKIVKLAD